MKYVIGCISNMLGDEFKFRYANCRCIEANCEKEAIQIYTSTVALRLSDMVRCIGFLDNNMHLVIENYNNKYTSARTLPPVAPGNHYYLVSKLLDSPKKLTDFGLYVPKFILATSIEYAIKKYDSLHKSNSFKSYCLGYLDGTGAFIVPDILDYIS